MDEDISCHVVYLDQRHASEVSIRHGEMPPMPDEHSAENMGSTPTKHPQPERSLGILLDLFHEVHICKTATSCFAKIEELVRGQARRVIPVLVLLDIPEQAPESNHYPPSHSTGEADSSVGLGPQNELYGRSFLLHLATEIERTRLPKLVVPVAVLRSHGASAASILPLKGLAISDSTDQAEASRQRILANSSQALALLEGGASDVLFSPFSKDRLEGLAVQALRAHHDAAAQELAERLAKRNRKRSWVGIDERQPFEYLREKMVSTLMDGICRPQADFGSSTNYQNSFVLINQDRRRAISAAVGTWGFSAHDFTEDELLWGAVLMLEHALVIPELEPFRISTERLTDFLVASKAAYNSFVPYHNFRHVIDVLQAVFTFLVKIEALPPYPLDGSDAGSFVTQSSDHQPQQSAASLVRPFDALTLLITAIGHDAGHPGVNNAFLVNLNAPLAQLYNDQSVLESFHCAAYSQILRRYWPNVFDNKDMRKLLISSILATDMQLHFDYMKKMGWAQEKIADNPQLDTWDPKTREEHRRLFCSLLIKCADISNVARPFITAAKWADILTDEFARQASMEEELAIPSALFAPPVRDSITELGKSQIGFMNLFALPLFQGVRDLMPAMHFAVDEMHANQRTWQSKIDEDVAKRKEQDENAPPALNGALSPRSGSPSPGILQSRKAAKSRSSINSSNRASKLSVSESRDSKSGSRRSSSIITITQLDTAINQVLQNGSRKGSQGSPDNRLKQLSGTYTNGYSPIHQSRRSSRNSMSRPGNATVEPTRVYATVLPSKMHQVRDVSPHDMSMDEPHIPRSQSVNTEMLLGHSDSSDRLARSLTGRGHMDRSYSTPPTIEELTASVGKGMAVANLDSVYMPEGIRNQAQCPTNGGAPPQTPPPVPLKRKASKWRMDSWFKSLRKRTVS